ncbi:MAG TPA: hypothetical protein VJZ26_19430 [Blastocatellia bacterium]|nr:hypothetical protein [Blastocatellia bacterium]
MGTKPTIETVLERINALAGQLMELRKEQNEFRAEMNVGFRRIERRLGVLSDDMNQVRADQRELESRMDKLEEKAL